MINQINYKVKCEIAGCKNDANYCIYTKKHFSPKIHFCEECKQKLYFELGKSIIPKSLDAPYSPKRMVKN